MELTNKQQEGLQIAVAKFRNREKYVVISGYAGSGKSTLVRFIIDALSDYGIDPELDVAYCAPTGAAAEVLRKKGNPNAMTLHKLLFESIPLANGSFLRKRKEVLPYKVIVADETSMTPKSMIDTLLSYPVFVIFLGDNFQLPQISKDEAHDLLDHPDIFLDEIMRQAQESEIIRLSMNIREGKPLPLIKGNEVQIFKKKDLNTGMLQWADIILCATNNTRHNLNQQKRQLLGFEGELQNNETLIVKSNYWNDFDSSGNPLINGSIVTVKNLFKNFVTLPRKIQIPNRRIDFLQCDLETAGGGAFTNFTIDRNFLLNETPCVPWKIEYQLNKMKKMCGELLPKRATYGYAVTCHAAQGSEWEHVLAIEERFPFDKEEHARWLYTSVTRSSKKCVLIKNS